MRADALLARRACLHGLVLATVVPPYASSAAGPKHLASSTATTSWNLANGAVTLPATFACGPLDLAELSIAGSGASGAVFAAAASLAGRPARVAVKVSWPGAATAAVANEQAVLERLSAHGAPGFERVLGACAYDELGGSATRSAATGRRLLALSPFVTDAAERVDELPAPLQRVAVRGLAASLVGALSASVATVDVQLLVERATGVPTLVDLTEGRVILGPEDTPLSGPDLALATGFIIEVSALVPEPLRAEFEARVAEYARNRPPRPELAQLLVEQLSAPGS